MRGITVVFGVSALTLASVAAASGPQPWPIFAVDGKVGMKVGDARLQDVVSVEGNLFTTNVLTFREGGDDGGVRKIAGPSTPGEILVRRAVRTDDVLWGWYQQVLAGDLQRKDVAVVYHGGNGQPAVRFDLTRCFPSAYALHAGVGQTTTAVEAVTITCEGASRAGQ